MILTLSSLQIKSDVRFIGTEDLEDDDNEYCVAFFNRRTKQTEYKPVSLLRVVPQKRRKVEESGILEGRRQVVHVILLI